MRSSEKNLPKAGKLIVYYNAGVRNGMVGERNNKPIVSSAYGETREIKTGFLWCYDSDIETPQEIN